MVKERKKAKKKKNLRNGNVYRQNSYGCKKALMIESYQWEGSEKKVMKKLYYLIRMTFQTKFAYIKAFWSIFSNGGLDSDLLFPLEICISVQGRAEWIYGGGDHDLRDYFRLLSSQFSGGINREFSEWVQKGNIVVELLRPVPLVFTLLEKEWGIPFLYPFQRIPVSILATFILGGTVRMAQQTLHCFSSVSLFPSD